MADERGIDEMINALRTGADLGLAPHRQQEIEDATDGHMAGHAQETSPRPRPGLMRRARWAIVGVGTASLATVIAVVSLGGTTATAQAGVTLLNAKPVAITDPTTVAGVRGSVGEGADLGRVWSAPASGGDAYLVRRAGDWCLSAPDPATRHPDLERGSTCLNSAEFDRFGIALTIGRGYVAAVVADAPAPTLTDPDGLTRTLKPTHDGVVVLTDLTDGTTVTRYAADGATRTDRIAEPDVASKICGDGERHFFGPGQTCQSEGFSPK